MNFGNIQLSRTELHDEIDKNESKLLSKNINIDDYYIDDVDLSSEITTFDNDVNVLVNDINVKNGTLSSVDIVDASFEKYSTDMQAYNTDSEKLSKIIENDITKNALIKENSGQKSYYLFMSWVIILIVIFSATMMYMISESKPGFIMMLLMGIVVIYSLYFIAVNIYNKL